VDANGGPPQALCDATNGRGGTWNQEDVILFARSTGEPLMRVAASGGTAVNVTELNTKDNETSHRWPQFLPDGKHFIFWVQNSRGSEQSGIYEGSLDSKEYKPLVHTSSSGAFAAGYLLFVRDTAMLAQKLDWKKMALQGDAIPIADHVSVNTSVYRSVFTLSNTGTLIYLGGGGSSGSQLIWYDRSGQKQELAFPDAAVFRSPRLSPDGKRVAVGIESGTVEDIWVIDLKRQTKTRITFGPTRSFYPVWSADGKWIYYGAIRGQTHIFRRASDGTGGEEPVLVTDGVNETPTSMSADGKYLAYFRSDPKSSTKSDLFVLPLFGDAKPILQVSTPANEVLPRFSSDGKWIAYLSDETGRFENYIKPFSATGKYQVSTTGGGVEFWRGDGRELFYVTGDSLYAVDVRENGSALELGTPRPIMKVAAVSGTDGPFEPAADGKRFLVNSLLEQKGTQTLTLVNNWTADLKK
jgi:Tol biopolymer transport system component